MPFLEPRPSCTSRSEPCCGLRPTVPSVEGAERQTSAVLRLVQHALQENVVGAYLHGSAVLGGLRPDSDLDVLVVSRRSLVQPERTDLLNGLLDLSGCRARVVPGRPVELTVVVYDDVNPWRYPPRADFQYGEWLRSDYEEGLIPAPRWEPDLAVLITMTTNGGLALLGPPPASVLPAVPSEDVTEAIAAGVPDLLEELRSDTRNVLLTLARVWTTMATGTLVPKDAAADWVLARLPTEHRRAVVLARDAYLGNALDNWDDHAAQALSLSHYMVERIERLRTQAD